MLLYHLYQTGEGGTKKKKTFLNISSRTVRLPPSLSLLALRPGDRVAGGRFLTLELAPETASGFVFGSSGDTQRGQNGVVKERPTGLSVDLRGDRTLSLFTPRAHPELGSKRI